MDLCTCVLQIGGGRRSQKEVTYSPEAFDKKIEDTENNFCISQPKHMFWVLKRTVSLRRFF